MIHLGHALHRLPEVAVQLFLRDPAKGFILAVHADVKRLVKATEHTDLGKLGHSGQKYKLKVFVRALEYGVETFQDIAVLLLKTCIHIEHIQNRLIVFINQHHSTETSLFMSHL